MANGSHDQSVFQNIPTSLLPGLKTNIIILMARDALPFRSCHGVVVMAFDSHAKVDHFNLVHKHRTLFFHYLSTTNFTTLVEISP